jgi:hypothetical protein
MNTHLNLILQPVIESALTLSQHRMALHKMFAMAMANIPDDETDNFTAKELLPAYLNLCQLLENLVEIES